MRQTFAAGWEKDERGETSAVALNVMMSWRRVITDIPPRPQGHAAKFNYYTRGGRMDCYDFQGRLWVQTCRSVVVSHIKP